MERYVQFSCQKGRNSMKEVTFDYEHPGKLKVVAVVIADNPAMVQGLKNLHAELSSTEATTSIVFDDVAGTLTVTVDAESDGHKAKVKADAAAAAKAAAPPKPAAAKKTAVKKKAKK
jgi:hypothetical protein